MTVRRRKKKNDVRGERTHGKGNTKNHRGSGSKGGKGRAGSHKHKYSKYLGQFGRFQTLKPKVSKGDAINLYEIEEKAEQLIKKKLLEEKDGKIIFDGKKLKVIKILGQGEITRALLVKNTMVSKKAREKIIKAGGSVEGDEENVDDEDFEVDTVETEEDAEEKGEENAR